LADIPMPGIKRAIKALSEEENAAALRRVEGIGKDN